MVAFEIVDGEVVPTRVGVNLVHGLGTQVEVSCPHTRGGEPFTCRSRIPDNLLSPHAWG